MRLGGRLAAAALAALAALPPAGCDLASSLTPFGLGERGPAPLEGNLNGAWVGTTSSGGPVAFLVVDDTITEFALAHSTPPCVFPFAGSGALPVIDDAFTTRGPIEPQGTAQVEGRFTSADTVSGSYSFEGLPTIAQCPTAVSGTFEATKSRAASAQESRP